MNKNELNPIFSEFSTQESATINGGAYRSKYRFSPEVIEKLWKYFKKPTTSLPVILPTPMPILNPGGCWRLLGSNFSKKS